MLRMLMSFVFACLLTSPVLAQDSLAGTWEDAQQGLKIVFTSSDGALDAKIHKGSTTFDFDGYSYQESNGVASMNGQFTDGKGGNFPFSAEIANGEMIFRTGKSEYRLKRQGGAAPAKKDRNPLDDGESITDKPADKPAPRNPIEEDAAPAIPAGGAYRHKSGLWSLNAPGAGWTKEESPDGNTTKWTHGNGALVFVTIVPDVPFNSAQQFFENALKPGFTQAGAQFVDEGPLEVSGVPSHVAMFNRTRNNVQEYASCVCTVVNGKGIIFQMSAPTQVKDALSAEMGPIFESFKVNK